MSDPLLSVPLGGEAAFPKREFDGRIEKVQKVMAEKGFDLYMTCGPENIFYLTGQQTPGYSNLQMACIPVQGNPFFILRATEAFNARLHTYVEEVFGYGDGDDAGAFFAKAVKEKGWAGKRIAVDGNAWFLPPNIYKKLEGALGTLLDGSGIVEPFRRVKSKLEIACMEKAAKATLAGMQAGLKVARPGCTDNQVAAAVINGSILAGSEYLGMEPFVTGGKRGGVVHTTWKRKKIKRGDILVIENAACYNRYHTALFRTIAMGKVPQAAVDQYEVCVEGLQAAIDTARPGVTCADVHNAVQRVIDKAGYTEGFKKRAGYSIGIAFAPDWGEGNIMSLFKNVHIPLVPGMTFHVPVTLREFYKHTVAVSETLLITEKGCKPFSKLSRKLVRKG